MNELPIDSIYDPDRPLNVSPERWAIAKKEKEKLLESIPVVDDMDPFTRLDNSVDGIIQYIMLFYETVDQLSELKLSPNDLAVIYKIKDLMDTGVSPYLSDIVKELDNLES